MLFRNPKSLAFLLLALGVGLCGYYGQKWYELPEWSEAEIAQSVEINLELDLQRMGPHLRPTGERLEDLRRLVRSEVEAEIRKEREGAQKGLGAGLIALVLAVGQLLAVALKEKAGST